MNPNPYERQISANDAGQRIDNFLLRILKGVPRSRIYRAITSGEVRINKKRVKPSDRIETGDMVRVPPIRTATREVQELTPNLAKMLQDRIIYEDKNFLVLNKPSGLAVHGGSGLSLGVIEAMRLLYPQESLELVHRLDKETSGCLMIAKKRSMLRYLHEALREEGRIEKKYLTLVVGCWPSRKTSVDMPLLKNILSSGERIVVVSEEGKEAKTLFHLKETYQHASLVQAIPLTGRTHQIRVHAAYAGHPVAGDEKYGDKVANQQLREQGLKRLFLHAATLVIPQPDGTQLTVDAPLEANLSTFLEKLR